MTAPERDPDALRPEPDPAPGSAAPQLPWGDGKARRIDIVCWGGIIASGLWALATLPFVPSLLGTHPVLLSAIRGSTTSMITAGAFARVGDASIVAALLAPMPLLMLWGPFFWLAGWLWGTTGIELLAGRSARSRRAAERVRRHAPRWIVPLILFGYVLPIPSQLIWVAAGWIRMRLVVFLTLNAIASFLWVLLCVGLGYEIGQGAVDVAKAISRYALWVTLGLVVVVFAVQLRRAGPRRPDEDVTRTRQVLALAVAATALGVTPHADAAAAAAANCRPVDGLRTDAVVRRKRPPGSDVTEFFANGGYRVTRCTTSGQILGTQENEPVEVPGGRRALLPVSTFTSRASGPQEGTVVTGELADPTDPVFVAAWAADGARIRSSRWAPGASLSGAVARAARSRAMRMLVRERAQAGAVGDSCTNREYHWEGPTLAFGRYVYRVNPRRLPHGAADVTQIVNGHETFRRTLNDCGFPDVTDVVPAYAGTTSTTAHSAAAPDGVNTVDFGPMANIGCSPVFVACTIYSFANGLNFSDIDTRFNAAMTFSTVGAARAYDLWSTAAHETGHAVGLAHATSSRYLTMYPQGTLGATWKRTLARGDAIGFRCRYGITAGGC